MSIRTTYSCIRNSVSQHWVRWCLKIRMVFPLVDLCRWGSSLSGCTVSVTTAAREYWLSCVTPSVFHVGCAKGWIFCFHKEFADDCMATSEAPGQCKIFCDRVNRRSVKSGSPWPVSFLTPCLGINQYLLTKALPAFSPLSALLFIFQDVIRVRSEMSGSLQGKYLCECHRESRGGGGWKYFPPRLCLLVLNPGAANIWAGVMSLPAAISPSRLFLPCSQWSHWRGWFAF